jgi:hypothetical protein
MDRQLQKELTMRNLLALIGAALVAFLVVGWYLGWYQISSPTSPSGKQSLQVDINQDKITDDMKRGGELVDQFRDKAKSDSKESQPGPATNFFTPTPTEKDKSSSSGGWRPIGSSTPKK